MPRHFVHACVSGSRVPAVSAVTFAVMSPAGSWLEPGVPSRSRPDGTVCTPMTRSPSASSDATGNPGNTCTPSASASAPSHRTISEIETTKLP